MLKKRIIIVWLIFYALILAILLYNSFDYLDPDLGWHLKVGQKIISQKEVPVIEEFDYPILGRTWVDHEWLMNAISFFIFHKLGYISLTVFFALIVILSLVLMNIFIQRKYLFKKNDGKYDELVKFKLQFFLMLCQLAGVIAMLPSLGVRMQEIALLNLVLLLIIIDCFSQNKRWPILFMPFLFYFWASSHGSYTIGVVIIILWPLVQITSPLVNKLKILSNFLSIKKIELKNYLLFTLFAFLSIGATLITPYGLKLYSFLSEYVNNFYLYHIAEWLPSYYYPLEYKQLLYLTFFLCLLFIYFFEYFYNRRKKLSDSTVDYYKDKKMDIWYLAIAMLFFVMALKSKRHFNPFYIASFPLLFSLIDMLILKIPIEKFWQFLKNNKIVHFYAIIACFLAIGAFALKTNFTATPFSDKEYCTFYPCEAINFVKSNPKLEKLKIFNNYGWGGFMIWVWPEKKLFIDGRLPQLKFENKTFLEEYYDFNDSDLVKSRLDKYNIDLVFLMNEKKIKLNWYEKYILKMDEAELNSENKLKKYLDGEAEWKKIYNDLNVTLYARNI